MTSLYRLLFRLYPTEFREQFQKEMLRVIEATTADARGKGIVERVLLALHETIGLILGAVRERRLTSRATQESRMSSLRAPVAILLLYTLCAWTMTDLGLHALFSATSYAILLAGMLLGLWMVSSQRVLGARRNRTALVLLALFFWLGLPFALRISEGRFRARLIENPAEFSYRFAGIAAQGTIVTPELTTTQRGLTASETIPLADDRSLLLVMRTESGAPPYRVLIPLFLMGLSFGWRRHHSRRATAE